MDIYGRAKELAAAGLTLVPILPYRANSGDKRPAIGWKQLTQQPLTSDQIDHYFRDTLHGIGVVMGAASRGLLMIELEGRGAHLLPKLGEIAEKQGAASLWAKLCGGWMEKTPSGGYHWYCFVPDNTHGNRKLAQIFDPDSENWLVLAETRENGGYSVVAPLDGQRFHHSTSGEWAAIVGGPASAPTFTLQELDQLFAVFATLDEKTDTKPTTILRPIVDGGSLSPGDDFENQTSWDDILLPHNWQKIEVSSTETKWRRPGKTSGGHSATTGYAGDRDRLYCFSTNCFPFEPETPYTKFAAYAYLNHAGNFQAAAQTLRQQGFGKRLIDLTPLSVSTGSVPATGESSLELESLTDDGNAQLFTKTYVHQYRYVPEKKQWVWWDGHKWAADGGSAKAMRAARELARMLPSDDKAAAAHRKRALSRSGLEAMLVLASTSETIYTPLPHFDANPYMLNTPAGLVDLRTNQVSAPAPSELCLRSTTVAPDWDMPTPRWNNFLAQTFSAEQDLTSYVQRYLGMSLVGEVRDQVFGLYHGTGANGKTTMLNVVQNILGEGETGYSTTVQASMFLAGTHHDAEMAALQGVRLAVTSETEEGQKFAEARVKLLTGADRIQARFLYGNFFTFIPSHTIIMVSNHEPEVAAGGAAFWRRIKKIPFKNVVPPEARDPELEKKLMDEAPGILAWLLDGTKQYLQYGLMEPSEVSVATEEYAFGQDSVRMFLDEQCVLGDPNNSYFQATVPAFRRAYETWCAQNGYQPVNPKTLTQQLRTVGVLSARVKSSRIYRGVLLNVVDSGGFVEADRLGEW